MFRDLQYRSFSALQIYTLVLRDLWSVTLVLIGQPVATRRHEPWHELSVANTMEAL